MRSNIITKITNSIFSGAFIFNKFRSIIHNNYKNEKKIIIKNFKRDKKTLDFGCGIGQFSILFSPKNYYGVDVDKKYINFCKLNKKGNFFIIRESPPYKFNKNYFDQILVSAVIHHINDKKLINISKEFKRILKNNGRLIIIEHFIKTDQKNIICKFLINFDRGKYFRNPDKVINLFSKDFKVKNKIIFKNGPYKDYVLTLIKK